MKIRHLRDHTGKPFGTVVFNGDTYGVSICNKKDHFNKKMGVKIAAGRAEKVGVSKLPASNRRIKVRIGDRLVKKTVFDIIAGVLVYDHQRQCVEAQ